MSGILLALLFSQGGVVPSSAHGIELPPQTCASYARPAQGARFREAAFKGVELYGWPVLNGGCRFSLLWGTNRQKEEREIKALACTLPDLRAVQDALVHFAEGETVTWVTSAVPAERACATAEAVQTLREHSAALGINFQASVGAK